MTLTDLHQQLGGVLAPDGIPLHYGNQADEYRAALEHAVLMERSHEGRLEIAGRDQLALLQRMSTNDVESLADGEGRPTIFTSPIGRILDRITVYRRGDVSLLLTEPGRSDAVRTYLQRNIFFNDDVRLTDLAPSTQQFVLHGPRASEALAALDSTLSALPPLHGKTVSIAGNDVFAARTKPLVGDAWVLVVPNAAAAEVWSALLAAGQPFGLRPAGSLTYNVLRIRAGRPGVGRELSNDYIPLEVGLWDEVSFQKGCYTGQEIIARMESRGRLAKTIVSLKLDAPVQAPAPLMLEGREAGTLTSSVQTPDGDVLGIGVVKTAAAQVGQTLSVGEHTATITRLAGVQPAQLSE